MEEGKGAEQMPKNIVGMQFYLRPSPDAKQQGAKMLRLRLDEFFWENVETGKDMLTVYLTWTGEEEDE